MTRSLARIRGIGYVLWHARHMFYHVLLGLCWAFVLKELWGEFSINYVLLAVFGSLVPDIEHVIYFFVYGRGDEYAHVVKEFLKAREWRALTTFIEQGHKYNTNLSYHNVYFVVLLFILTIICFVINWDAWMIVLGAMVIHYLFDIVDDYRLLGYLNSNWRRWGRDNRNHQRSQKK